MTSEAPTTRDELSGRQLERLRDLCRVQLGANSFYGPRLRSAGLTRPPESLDAFTSQCPLTTKQDFREDRAANPPYGSNLSKPIEEYVRLHQTSSTTGEPVRWIDTREDWEAMLDGWIEVLEAAGLTRADRVFGAASFGPFIGFWLGFEAAEKMGCLVIPGGAMTTSTRIRAILANEVTAVLCTPTYAIRLGETAREEGIDLSSGAVRRLIVAGEPGGSVPAVRERIERLWPGASVFDHHGMTECGPATYECPKRPGVLHLIESNLLCEFIDT
jgi:phenylacetate-CoA ligase